MDWLSKRKFVIVCYKKVVRIPLEGDEILRVHGERTLGAVKALMNAKVDEPRINDIPVVRDFIDVVLEDLLGLPPQRQVEFRIDLVLGATPVAKSTYRLAPSEMQEMSEQLQELEDRRPTKDKGELEVYLKLVLESRRREVLGDALSRKERVKSRRVRGMILAVQSEAFKQENVLVVGSVMDEVHASRYLVHPRADKTYYNLGDMYCLRYLSENEIESPWILSLNFQGQSSEYDVIWVMIISKERNSGKINSRLSWRFTPYGLATEKSCSKGVKDAIDVEYFSYCLASSSEDKVNVMIQTLDRYNEALLSILVVVLSFEHRSCASFDACNEGNVGSPVFYSRD
ncbi:hypothetical protein Tco_0406950 [Tanacetum coccineum]